eukprot:11280143-Karenia_brevis.AAC.1
MMAMATTSDATLQSPNCRGPPQLKTTYQHMGNHEDRSTWRPQASDEQRDDFHDAQSSDGS